jgi:hypothetical protein
MNSSMMHNPEWPAFEGEPTARITSVTLDGVTHECDAAVILKSKEQFIAERVLAIKRELLRAWWGMDVLYSNVRQHQLPITVDSFSDLHAYCDANELGGLCDVEVVAAGRTLVNDEEDWIDLCNEVQTAIDQWLKSRESVDDFAIIVKHMDFESVDCFLDDERNEEAHGMLDDLESRVWTNLTPMQTARIRILLPA